jgi:hypothetical protein
VFDGASLAGWTTLDGQPVTRGWEVVDGMIHLAMSGDRGGNIVTAREVGDFVLSFDFKIAPGGNSGIKYRVKDFGGRVLGCEYQIYDDASEGERLDPKGTTGSLYDVYEPIADKPLNPPGEFNRALIIVRDDVIEHWLNGRRLLRADVGSPEWDRRIAASKFNDVPGFGENRSGRIMLTDHGSEVWFANFQFIELPSDATLIASAAEPSVTEHEQAPASQSVERVVSGSGAYCFEVAPRPTRVYRGYWPRSGRIRRSWR